MSKGITKNDDLSNIEIYRSTYDQDRKNPIETIKVSLDADLSNLSKINNTELKVDDLVVVRKKLGFQEKEFVTVEGLVKYPAPMQLKIITFHFLI